MYLFCMVKSSMFRHLWLLRQFFVKIWFSEVKLVKKFQGFALLRSKWSKFIKILVFSSQIGQNSSKFWFSVVKLVKILVFWGQIAKQMSRFWFSEVKFVQILVLWCQIGQNLSKFWFSEDIICQNFGLKVKMCPNFGPLRWKFV